MGRPFGETPRRIDGASSVSRRLRHIIQRSEKKVRGIDERVHDMKISNGDVVVAEKKLDANKPRHPRSLKV